MRFFTICHFDPVTDRCIGWQRGDRVTWLINVPYEGFVTGGYALPLYLDPIGRSAEDLSPYARNIHAN